MSDEELKNMGINSHIILDTESKFMSAWNKDLITGVRTSNKKTIDRHGKISRFDIKV